MGATYWGMDYDPVPKCKAFVRNVVMLWEVLGSIPGQGGRKNLCGRRDASE